MSFIEQQITIAAPLGQAAKRLRNFFSTYGNAEGSAAKLDLRVLARIPTLPIPLVLHRSVIATIQANRLESDMEPRYRVQWAPAVPGPFPLFAGEIFVAGDDDYTSFTLVLRGHYSPPLGLLGKVFDSVVGGYVARATARDLLTRIRDFAQEDFQEDEKRKAEVRRGAIGV